MKKHFLSLLLVALVLVSCHTSEKIVYFQDVPLNRPEVIEAVRDITLQPQDQISIIVSSKDPELASLFNLTRAQYRAGYTTMSTNYGNGEVSGYTLDQNGDIDFPQLGTIHIGGLTKSQVAAVIKQKIIDSKLIKDPVVTVEFMNLYFSVLGEVKNPGKYTI